MKHCYHITKNKIIKGNKEFYELKCCNCGNIIHISKTKYESEIGVCQYHNHDSKRPIKLKTIGRCNGKYRDVQQKVSHLVLTCQDMYKLKLCKSILEGE